MNQAFGPYEIRLESDPKIVARLVGLGLYFWLIISMIGYLTGTVADAGAHPPPSGDSLDESALLELATEHNEGLGTLAYAKLVPEPETEDPSSDWGTGTYLVAGSDAEIPTGTKGDIGPGLYSTPIGATDCSYELWRAPEPPTKISPNYGSVEEFEPRVIGEDYLGQGRMLVWINEIEPDWFVSSPGCIGWSEWKPPLQPLTIGRNGDYWAGDLAHGEWHVPKHCRWSKVVAFRGAVLHDVTAYGRHGAPLVIDEDTLGVSIRGCMPSTALSLIPRDETNKDRRPLA